MTNYIYDNEKQDFLRDNDGERMPFKDNQAVYDYLSKEYQYKDDFIKENFSTMKACKILIPEDNSDVLPHPVQPESENPYRQALEKIAKEGESCKDRIGATLGKIAREALSM